MSNFIPNNTPIITDEDIYADDLEFFAEEEEERARGINWEDECDSDTDDDDSSPITIAGEICECVTKEWCCCDLPF